MNTNKIEDFYIEKSQ